MVSSLNNNDIFLSLYAVSPCLSLQNVVGWDYEGKVDKHASQKGAEFCIAYMHSALKDNYSCE